MLGGVFKIGSQGGFSATGCRPQRPGFLLVRQVSADTRNAREVRFTLVCQRPSDKTSAPIGKPKYSRMEVELIECNEHGSLPIAFVCQHLFHGEHLGFHQGYDEDDEPTLSGWCDKCEEVRARDHEWNDDNMAFAAIQLVCSKCFEHIKNINLQ